MRFATAYSTIRDLADGQVVRRIVDRALEKLGSPVDLALVFFSHDLADLISNAAPGFCSMIGTDNVLGCSAESIVADRYEFEWQTALSIWLANLGNSEIQSCHLSFERLHQDGGFSGWPDSMLDNWPDESTLIALGDPFSFPMDVFLNRVNEDRPSVPVIGGMCSGSTAPGESLLLLGNRVFDSGAVVTRLSGDFRITTLVSQGCRPIGQPLVITRAERNEIFELNGRPALQVLKQTFDALPTREQELVNTGLHVGRVVDEYKENFGQGDFLIRNLLGVDEENNSLVVADYFRPGQTVQFQIRDHETADLDLRELLGRHENSMVAAQAGLLFSCNGRGTRLFPVEHHDAATVCDYLNQIPLAGFFAAGEIGPVAGTNFLHGLTASLALFSD